VPDDTASKPSADMVWLATLICVNLQTSFLTPPFGWALFFLRGVAPPEVSTGDIYRGIIPFVLMQVLALVLCFTFAQLAALAAEDDRLVSHRRDIDAPCRLPGAISSTGRR
jgi:TRAP-type mannitol/chloroaromatic compound transport system permease large subunit